MSKINFELYEPTVLNGSYYDIGLKHGRLFKDQVHRSIETYEKMFWNYSALNWVKAREKAKLHIDAIWNFNEGYIKEMEGIAKGAGLDFEDVLALNARSEIALVKSNDGCTSFFIESNDEKWLFQNWDWKNSQLDTIVNVIVKHNQKPAFTMITEAGIIGKIGFNNEGVGVCLNALKTDALEEKVPIHLGLRAILESSSTSEAVKLVEGKMASAAHFLIGDRNEVVSLEVSPYKNENVKKNNRYAVHANHICSNVIKNKLIEHPKQESYKRQEIGENIISEFTKYSINKERAYEILSDHSGYPNSICRHESLEDEEHERMETVFSIVMNLNEMEQYWSLGQPCLSKERYLTRL